MHATSEIAFARTDPRVVPLAARPFSQTRSALPAAFAASLSSDDRAAIEALRPSIRRLEAGQTLFEQGDLPDHVYILAGGWALRHRTLADGRRQILDFALPGALLGWGSGAGMGHGVEARTDCTLCAIPRGQFRALTARLPSLALRIAESFAEGEAVAFDRLTTVGQLTARERVAHLLHELAGRARRAMGRAAGTEGFDLPLTQTHIADALGLTSVHVCRTLAELRKDNVLLLRAGKLKVLDMARLREEAGVDETLAA